MDTISGSPFTWLEFQADGTLVDTGAATALKALAARPGITDLVVISHGWKNDRADATKLYGTLWANACSALTKKEPAQIAVCGILWPAKAYGNDLDEGAVLAAGGQALGVGTAGVARDLTDEEWAGIRADFHDVFGDRGEATLAAADEAAMGITTEWAGKLFEAAGAAIGASTSSLDSELATEAAPVASADGSRDKLLGLAAPPVVALAPSIGGTQGLGDIAGRIFRGPRAAVARLLNQLTYFEMKKRAGIIGKQLGAVVLPVLNLHQRPIRLHLVGHSFGARLVAAAADGLPPQVPLFSLTLLQGAFSHHAFAEEIEPGLPGAFRNVVGRPVGPIAITHTHNDLACTLAYALASRLARDMTQGIGDKDDPFGAMGANGAQKLDPVVLAPDVTGEAFAPKRGKVNHFRADAYIVKTDTSDAHNNVVNPICGKLVAAVIES